MRTLILVLLFVLTLQYLFCGTVNTCKRAIVILDSGHGGFDHGGPNQKGFPFVNMVGEPTFVAEDAYMYDVAKRIERLATGQCMKVVFTVIAEDNDRVSDVDGPGLISPHAMRYNLPEGRTPFRSKEGLRLRIMAAERLQKANKGMKPIWISLHFDYASPSSKGTVIYTAKGKENIRFSETLAAQFRKQSPGTKESDIVNKRDRLFVLKKGKISPRVLIEFGNFNNVWDRAQMFSPQGREQYARMVVEGLKDYTTRKK